MVALMRATAQTSGWPTGNLAGVPPSERALSPLRSESVLSRSLLPDTHPPGLATNRKTPMPLNSIAANLAVDALTARDDALDAQRAHEVNPSPETTRLRTNTKRKAKRAWANAKTAYARAKAQEA